MIDVLASEYGWTEDEVLDKPYYKLKEYIYCVKVRHYTTAIKEIKILNLGTHGTSEQVADFVRNTKPEVIKRKASEDDEEPVATTLSPIAPMDLAGIDFSGK